MNTGSGTDPAHANRSSITMVGTAATLWRLASTGNSVASTAVADTLSDDSAQRYASNTAGGQWGQVGVT